MTEPLYDRGLALRKEVLGEAYVEKALAAAGQVSRPVQDLATEYCWGYLWMRPGLSHRDRSLLNIGLASTLNRSSELKAQIKAAIHNGVTEAEIAEVALQVAVYCGVPAGLETATIAEQALAELRAG